MAEGDLSAVEQAIETATSYLQGRLNNDLARVANLKAEEAIGPTLRAVLQANLSLKMLHGEDTKAFEAQRIRAYQATDNTLFITCGALTEVQFVNPLSDEFKKSRK